LIIGKRLGLRPLQSEDAQFLFKWHNDSRVLRRFRCLKAQFCISMEDERKSVAEMIMQEDAQHFIVVELKGNEPAGLGTLASIDHTSASCEIQVIIGELDRWGEGYCTEAAKMLVKYAFRVLNLHRISAMVPEPSEEVFRCLDECGFIVEGRLRHDHFSGGEWRDTLVMAILVHEFRGD
jgi:RimJ/RimL family protein N-acetyltransferase